LPPFWPFALVGVVTNKGLALITTPYDESSNQTRPHLSHKTWLKNIDNLPANRPSAISVVMDYRVYNLLSEL